MSTPNAEALKIIAPPWETPDVQALRDYVGRNPRFLHYLAYRCPVIRTDSVKQAALTGAKHAGYEELFNVLGAMVAHEHREEASPFIPNDGER